MEYVAVTRRRRIIIAVLLAMLSITSIFSSAVGTARFSVESIFLGNMDEKAKFVLFEIRIPRVLMCIVAGSSLALAGHVVQTILRNPLASPFTLGISASAAFGAAFAIIFGAGTTIRTYLGGFQITNYTMVIVTAFVFSLLASILILLLSRRGNFSPVAIVLAGLAMHFLFSASTSLLQYFGTTEQVAAIVFWLFGSLGKTSWLALQITTVVFISCFAMLYRSSWKFNAMVLGEDFANSLGVKSESIRKWGMAVASILTATVVSFLGIIAFLCMVSPHISRLLLGSDDHRYSIPVSCLMGSLILLCSDTMARTAFQPLTLPVGILTSFLGVPMFVYLILRRGKGVWV
ncbi:MAG: iron ABC transporter permease [Archaeoglobaceae archaeon]